MKFAFYGGAGEVGRSCISVSDDEHHILLDCGIKLGETIEYPSFNEWASLNGIVVSHAHLDHCGYLPHVYSAGYSPRVYSTKPTRDLMEVLLYDYYRISKSNNLKLFSSKDVGNVMKNISIADYHNKFNIGFDVEFFNAGHILGSSMVRINDSVLYSGDICMRNTRVLDRCELGLEAETLIVESTYGKKDDRIPSYKESYSKMISIINETLDLGGFVLIPSFAVGRAQEILLALDDYMRSGLLRKVKIYVDGMIWKAMRIYRHNAYYANEDIKKRILMSDSDPFKSPNFFRPRSRHRTDVLKEPCIIVTTSGMLSGGPVLSYLEKLASDDKSTLLFVGYQADGTLGRRILEGERNIVLNETELNLAMRVEQVRLSGHADFNELLQFIKSIKGLENIFLIHGEDSDLPEYLKDYNVIIPEAMKEYVV